MKNLSAEMYLEKLLNGKLEEALTAISWFDDFLASTENIEEKLIHELISALGHRIWLIRSKLHQVFLKNQDKIYPFLSDYLSSENVDIQYWSIQIYCAVAQQYYEKSKEEKDNDKRKKYLQFVERNVKRLTSVYETIHESNHPILIEGLARIRYPNLIPFFAAQLNADKWILRKESAKGLVEIGSASVPHLKKMIIEGSRDQRYWSFKSLGQLLGEKALEPFFRVLSSTDYPEEIHIYALSGIKEVGTVKAIPYLIKALSSDLWAVRAQASEALIQYQNQVVDNLLDCFDSSDQNLRFWALKTLAEVVSADDIEKIEQFVTSPDQELRFYTITALARIASTRAIQLISQCFNDEAWLIRKHAADALLTLGDKVIQPLAILLKEKVDNEEVVFWVLQVFSNLKIKTVLPALSNLLYSERKDYRLYAVRAIAQIPGEESLRILINGFGNDLWIVRHECYRELKKNNSLLPHLLALRAIHHENNSIHFWVTKFLKEAELPGVICLSEELEKQANTAIDHIIDKLEALQDKYIWEIFRSNIASTNNIQDFYADPFKRKIDHVAHPVEPPKASPITGVSLPAETVISNSGINYFHFEQTNLQDYPHALEEILEKMVFLGASDLHLKHGKPPMVRVNGSIQAMEMPELSTNQIRTILRNNLSSAQQLAFCRKKQLDYSCSIATQERFRSNIFLSEWGIEAAFRHISSTIPTFSSLNLPEELLDKVSRFEHGLILITGLTGSGKSSTLASIVGAINRRDHKHIICIEDPIEYLHNSQKSIVTHRQLGEHVDSFVDGLTAAMREDPDIVLVGEMRDPETIKSVLKLAGTGHLVFSTFHTASAPQTLEQIIQFFPAEERPNICAQLSFCLNAVISQILVPEKHAISRVPVLEALFGTQAVQNLIREGKAGQLYSVMQTSASDGMMTRDTHLKILYQQDKISRDTYNNHITEKNTKKPLTHDNIGFS